MKLRSTKTKYQNIKEKVVEAHVLYELNEKIEQQINTLGQTIKSSILEEIQSSLNKVETHVTEAHKSYSDATRVATENNNPSHNQPVSSNGLKSILKEARYEELKERRDHDQRLKTLSSMT